jgi:hypothetical protein
MLLTSTEEKWYCNTCWWHGSVLSSLCQLFRCHNCDACKTCLTPQELLLTSVFIYFKQYSGTEQSLACPSEKLVKTIGTAITLIESVMSKVGHLNLVE